MGYFTLFPIAKFEYDGLGGSIINLLDHTRINYNSNEVKMIKELLCTDIKHIEMLDVKKKQLLLELMETGNGYIYENKVYKDEHINKRDMEIRGLAEIPPHFSKIYLEVEHECNLNCRYCDDNIYIGNGCLACMKWKNKNNQKKELDIKKIINRICKLWVDEFIISGGNPLINKNLLKQYIRQIRGNSHEVKISIIFNGCGLDDDLLDYFIENDVSLVFAVMGYDAKSYETITGNSSVYKIMCDNIEKCRNKGLKCTLTIVGERDIIHRITKFAEELKINTQGIAEVYSNENEINPRLKFNERKKKITNNYEENQKYNSCLNGKLALTLEGIIKPCPMIDEELLDLKENSFDTLFQEMIIDKYWRFTKRKFDLCKNCPYKYSCEDCTAIEIAVNNKILDKNILCDRE